MPSAPDSVPRADSDARTISPPVDPHHALRVHFGMLLGVDDFETIDAYHRGKSWLHAAWLHRAGVVWGLGVSLDQARGEIRVEPGLALDGLGREVRLLDPACLNVGLWFAEHAEDPELAESLEVDGDTRHFDAHVTIRFRGCLERAVPALIEPCDGSTQTTAYSRIRETAQLDLVPGPPPRANPLPGDLPYHRLRLLFGLEGPVTDEGGDPVAADQEVQQALAEILALDPDERPAQLLATFRRLAALDVIDLKPPLAAEGDDATPFPEASPAPLTLATITGITLQETDAGSWKLTGGAVDVTVRPSHVATSTIQELLCGPATAGTASPPPTPPPESSPARAPDNEGGRNASIRPGRSGGPKVERASVRLEENQITFRVSDALLDASVVTTAFSVTVLDAPGWTASEIREARHDGASGLVTLTLRQRPAGRLVRLIARGTGPSPLLGSNLAPLAGDTDEPPGDEHDGRDFAHMLTIGT